MVLPFNTILLGNPASSDTQPDPVELARALTAWQAVIEAGGTANAEFFTTKALLDADLAHAAGTTAVVYSDGANNGVYLKAGASGAGSWSRILDYLPGYQFVTATDAGAGSANAIVATARPEVAYTDGAQLITLNISTTNTTAGVTVAFDGGDALDIKTASGNDPGIGALVAGMRVIGIVSGSGSEFRLLSDIASAAIQVGAEAARDEAETIMQTLADLATLQALVDDAEAAEAGAEAAQAASEAARDAAFLDADVYSDIATGLAAVSDGGQFMVVSADGLEIIRYERVDASTEDEVARYPSKNFVGETTVSQQKSKAQSSAAGKAVSYHDQNGAVRSAAIHTRTINGRRPEAITLGQTPNAGHFLDCLIYMNNSGQSLGEQHVGGGNQTLTQEYESRAFQFQDDTVANLRPLVSSDDTLLRSASTVNRYGENPMYGMCGFIWELLAKENGITPDDVAMRLITANNAKSATGIASLDQGSTEYNSAIAQAAALASGTPSAGDRLRIFGTGWYHGESDTDTLDYDDRLKQLAIDYAADFRAENTMQGFDPLLVAYQPTSDNAGSNRYAVNRLIFNACCDVEDGVQYLGSDVPLAFSTPNYFMDFRHDTVSGIHVKARDAKWLGGYTALVFKRVFIDGGTWPMMRPVSMEIENGAIFLKFQMRAPGTKLVVAESPDDAPPWDGSAIPRQTGRGFHCVDSGGSDITLASLPEVVAPDTIKIVPTGSTGDVVRIDYGQRAPLKMHPFGGSAGNFRDNYGDLVFYDAVNRPMHNWMPVHSIVPAANAAGFTLD